MSSEILTISLIATSSALVSIMLGYLIQRSKSRRYDMDRKIAELDLMRESYESKLYTLTNRLLVNEDRWKDVNHLLLSDKSINNTSTPANKPHLSQFLIESGLSEQDLIIEKNSVFVLTPFHTEMAKTYLAIKDVCNDVGLICRRGDEEFINSDILPHVLKLLVNARLVIVNIDGRNPNVFYELGIAHAIDKPIIIISKSLSDKPFDIASKRIILYQNENDLKEKLKNAITQALVSEKR